jgi:hypothetical protein
MPQKQVLLPEEFRWVEELLSFIRRATLRLHPQATLEKVEKSHRVLFRHILPFTKEEVGFLRTMIIEFARERGVRVGRLTVTKDLVYFDIPAKKGAAR